MNKTKPKKNIQAKIPEVVIPFDLEHAEGVDTGPPDTGPTNPTGMPVADPVPDPRGDVIPEQPVTLRGYSPVLDDIYFSDFHKRTMLTEEQLRIILQPNPNTDEPEIYVRKALNSAFGFLWDLQQLDVKVDYQEEDKYYEITVKVRLIINDASIMKVGGNGTMIVRDATAMATADTVSEANDKIEEATDDALIVCARSLGLDV